MTTMNSFAPVVSKRSKIKPTGPLQVGEMHSYRLMVREGNGWQPIRKVAYINVNGGIIRNNMFNNTVYVSTFSRADARRQMAMSINVLTGLGAQWKIERM